MIAGPLHQSGQTYTYKHKHATHTYTATTILINIFFVYGGSFYLCLNPIHWGLSEDFTPRLAHGFTAPADIWKTKRSSYSSCKKCCCCLYRTSTYVEMEHTNHFCSTFSYFWNSLDWYIIRSHNGQKNYCMTHSELKTVMNANLRVDFSCMKCYFMPPKAVRMCNLCICMASLLRNIFTISTLH